MKKLALKMLKSLLLSLFTEKFIKAAVVSTLKHFSAKTENKLDDKIVDAVEEAWS